jgi:hypothetical protein
MFFSFESSISSLLSKQKKIMKILSFFTALLFVLCAAVMMMMAMCVSAGTYDLAKALDGVYYSKVAYCDADQIAAWNCPVCAPKFPGITIAKVAQVEDKSSTGYVAYDSVKNRIVVAFRGTVSFGGWLEDFDFIMTQYNPESGCGSDCRVHEGLYWSYQLMMQQLLPTIQQLVIAHPTADIFISGHSMGAAQAGFAQADLVARFANVSKGRVMMYSFGEPRLGNVHFVKWQQTVLRESESFRVTNYGDPVVHLPPLIFDELDLGKWIHNPREVFYQNNFGSPADYKVCAGNYTYEDVTCADSTPLWAMSFTKHTTYLDVGMGCF